LNLLIPAVSGPLAEFAIVETVVCGKRRGRDQEIRTAEDIEPRR
jgi:hypothetical protein